MKKTVYGYSPTHPGEILKDEIEYRGITQSKVAAQMGMPYKILNDILNGRRPLTATSSMLFEAVLDIPADALMNLQLKYNMQIARKDKTFAKRLAQIRKRASIL